LPSRLRAFRRLGWGVADQGVSSVQNFVLGIFVAHSLGAASLGVFGLAMLTYAITINASRGLSTDPLMVRFSGVPKPRWRAAAAVATGTALLVGAACGLLVLICGVLLQLVIGPSDLGTSLMALAVVLPGLALQDSWRYAFFAAGEGQQAFLNDSVWTILLVAGLPFLQHARIELVILAYGITAAVAGALGAWQSRVVPKPGATLTWLRRNRDLGPRFLIENITLGASGSARSYTVAATSGMAAVGGVRGAEMLMGPIVALLMGIAQVAVPETVRALSRGQEVFRRVCLRLSLGLAAGSVLWGVVVLVMFPRGMGQLLLDTVWPEAHHLALAVVVSATFGCLAIGPSAGLRALGRADRTLPSQVVATSLAVLFGMVGAIMGGALGMVWGTAIASMLASAFWWYQFQLAYRRHFSSAEGVPLPTMRPATQADTPGQR
jgi:O-antigen/teichoic acid export membrane protein